MRPLNSSAGKPFKLPITERACSRAFASCGRSTIWHNPSPSLRFPPPTRSWLPGLLAPLPQAERRLGRRRRGRVEESRLLQRRYARDRSLLGYSKSGHLITAADDFSLRSPIFVSSAATPNTRSAPRVSSFLSRMASISPKRCASRSPISPHSRCSPATATYRGVPQFLSSAPRAPSAPRYSIWRVILA